MADPLELGRPAGTQTVVMIDPAIRRSVAVPQHMRAAVREFELADLAE